MKLTSSAKNNGYYNQALEAEMTPLAAKGLGSRVLLRTKLFSRRYFSRKMLGAGLELIKSCASIEPVKENWRLITNKSLKI